jgi:peptide/nickel transport system permease protein
MSNNKAFAADASRKERIKEWVSRPGGFGIITGCVMFAMITLAGILYPLFGPHSPDEFVGESLEGPSLAHPMGLDQLGRDVMTRVFSAVPADIGIAFLGVTIPLAIGTVVGILLGISKNKRIVSTVSSLIDGINAFPLLIIAIAMVTFLGPGLFNVVIILTLMSWARYARIARTKAVVVLQQNYIEATKLMGYSKRRVISKHVAPNVSSESLAYALSDFILVIIIVSGLSFLGFAARPPMPEWGSMIADGRTFLGQAWWLTVFPGLAICWSAISLSFIVEGLSRRDRGNS